MSHSSFAYLALIVSLALGSCSESSPVAAPYEVEDVPLSQISADLAAGVTTSVAIIEAYIERIKAHDDKFNAVIMIAPDAVQQAAASDQRRKDGKSLGPLVRRQRL